MFSAVADAGIVAVLTTYFLIDYPRIRTNLYRLVPHSRRPRAIAIGDQILAGVGGYVLGNVLISVITAVCTFAWLLIFDVPYPLILALLVALLDLIPIVGSTIAGGCRRPGLLDSLCPNGIGDSCILHRVTSARGLPARSEDHREDGSGPGVGDCGRCPVGRSVARYCRCVAGDSGRCGLAAACKGDALSAPRRFLTGFYRTLRARRREPGFGLGHIRVGMVSPSAVIRNTETFSLQP